MTRTDNVCNTQKNLSGEQKGMMPIETSKEGTFKRFRDGKKA